MTLAEALAETKGSEEGAFVLTDNDDDENIDKNEQHWRDSCATLPGAALILKWAGSLTSHLLRI